MAMRPRQIRKTAEYLTRKSFLTTAAGLALCSCAYDRHEEGPWTKELSSTKGYSGYINKSGAWVLPPRYYHAGSFEEDRIAEVSFPTGERDACGQLQQTEEWYALIDSSGELLVSPTSWSLLKHRYDLVFRYNVRSTNHRSSRLPDWQDYRGWSNGLAAAKAAE